MKKYLMKNNILIESLLLLFNEKRKDINDNKCPPLFLC